MANNILTKLFGNYSKRELKRVQPQVDQVLALEDRYRAMSDQELKAETGRFPSGCFLCRFRAVSFCTRDVLPK